MRSSVVGRLIVISAIFALPLAAYGQEATVSGTVTDSTGGVLPGVVTGRCHTERSARGHGSAPHRG